MAVGDPVSCCPELLYGQGGYHDPAHPLATLVEASRRVGTIHVEAMLFEASRTPRPALECVGHGDEAARLGAFFDQLAPEYQLCPASYLVRIDNALIWNSMVFTVAGNDLHPIYETRRHIDLPELGFDALDRLPPRAEHRRLPEGVDYLFAGSCGSFNYGHWLVDDFAKLAAVRTIKRRSARTTCVVMTSFGQPVDAVREQGAALFLRSAAGDAPLLLDRDTCYGVDALHFVTPVSLHPILKNAAALRFTRDTLLDAAPEGGPDRGGTVFVDRPEPWTRRLTNADEVRAAMARRGAHETSGAGMSLFDQVATFRRAGTVVGVMGAAMVNQIFCEPGSTVLHLAPAGWMEPFYWDLSGHLRQPYKVYYGVSDPDSHSHWYQQSFRVDLDAALSLL